MMVGLLLCAAQSLSVALAVRAALVVPARQAHIVTIGIKCCLDASSAVPQIPLIIQRQQVGYLRGLRRSLRRAVHVAHPALAGQTHRAAPHGCKGGGLRRAEEEATSWQALGRAAALSRVCLCSRVAHDPDIPLTTQIFRSQFYLAMIVDLLRMQGDTGAYADTFADVHPVSMLFTPILSWCQLPRGFVFSFAATLVVGLAALADTFVYLLYHLPGLHLLSLLCLYHPDLRGVKHREHSQHRNGCRVFLQLPHLAQCCFCERVPRC